MSKIVYELPLSSSISAYFRDDGSLEFEGNGRLSEGEDFSIAFNAVETNRIFERLLILKDSGAALVYKERGRQIHGEGFSIAHDDTHARGELAKAAVCYAVFDKSPISESIFIKNFWPWSWAWWKPDTRIRNLVKAAALLCAEIDRLLRLEKALGQAGDEIDVRYKAN